MHQRQVRPDHRPPTTDYETDSVLSTGVPILQSPFISSTIGDEGAGWFPQCFPCPRKEAYYAQ